MEVISVTKQGQKLKCPRCRYEWVFFGKSRYPYCGPDPEARLHFFPNGKSKKQKLVEMLFKLAVNNQLLSTNGNKNLILKKCPTDSCKLCKINFTDSLGLGLQIHCRCRSTEMPNNKRRVQATNVQATIKGAFH